jgi:hypothetical protein
MRSFLRTETTLVRSFPIVQVDDIDAPEAVAKTMDHCDGSGVSLRRKFDGFIEFLCVGCSSPEERDWYLEAAGRTRTGGIGVKLDDDDDTDEKSGQGTLPNVRVAMGATRRETRVRLMRAFNTPFFPDILVCSQVMGEGVDLQRFCRHVIHHDLDWNPSTIEQRTGRIDRLGCKAENRHPIHVYLPYLAGTADERQYRVMLDRERWFRIVMGQDEVARLITPDSDGIIPLPDAISTELSFRLDLAPALILESRMDHVELAAPRDRLARGCLADVILRGGKGGTELCCLRQVQFDHDIDIGRQPWLAVHTARQGTHQQIHDALILQDIDDPAQQISLLHGSSSGRFLASRLGRPNRGAASEGDPPNADASCDWPQKPWLPARSASCGEEPEPWPGREARRTVAGCCHVAPWRSPMQTPAGRYSLKDRESDSRPR